MELLLSIFVLGGLLPGASAVGVESRAASRFRRRLRHQLADTGHSGSLSCPGSPTPCFGKGDCDTSTGACFCGSGFGGTDCTTEVPDYYEVEDTGRTDMKDAVGRYKQVAMYLDKAPSDPANVKFIYYDPFNSGWAISKLNSTCPDDTCFFAYAKNQWFKDTPPPRGYVYGNTEKLVYLKQLVFDESGMDKTMIPGLHMAVSYSPDPNSPWVTDFAQFNGRYVYQPRYVHESTGKYAIFPVNFASPGKTWVLAGLQGTPRKWQILASVRDPSLNRYMVPKGPWEGAQLSLMPTCGNHVNDDTCAQLEAVCSDTANPDSAWVKKCCRNTCFTCQTVAKNECELPEAGLQGTAFLQRLLQAAGKASRANATAPARMSH